MRSRPAPKQLTLPTVPELVSRPPSRPGRRGGDALLLALAVIGGAIFWSSVGRIWPLARADLNVAPAELERRARTLLEERGRSTQGYETATWLSTDAAALDYVEEAFGLERSQRWIAEGFPLVSYRVSLKRAGEPDAIVVTLHPSGTALGWNREVEEDEPGLRLSVEQARARVRGALAEGLGLDLDGWEERAASSRDLPSRRDHTFTYERLLSAAPELRERAWGTVSGSEVTVAARALVVPGPARREATARAAPGEALEAAGIALLAVAAVFAFIIFLRRLADGTARLGRAGTWIAVLAVTQIATQLLRTASLFAAWETLWPRWVSDLRSIVYGSADLVWVLLVLLAFLVAGEALDRESGAGRGESLWALARGRFGDPRVAAASGRGFLVGLVCGGVLAGSVLVLEGVAGARMSIQPRGFFFYALNSASPSASTLLFFLSVALAEELGYRFFGATWLLSLTRRRWIAVAAPALLYGLTHTNLDFLPPADPFWARPLVLTLVGCVWGWAFLRWDALTVVLSHYTADLFIFNWPRLASGKLVPTAAALAVIAVPLLPAIGGWVGKRVRARRDAPAL